MPVAGNAPRDRASAHYKWAERYSRYGDAHRAASHFGRALYYTGRGAANFGGKPNCPEGRRCTETSGDHMRNLSHSCAYGPRCTRESPHHVETMHLLNLHRVGGRSWSVDEHYGACGQSCGCCAVYVDGADSGNCELCSYARLHRGDRQPGFSEEELERFYGGYDHSKDPPLKRK
jgi:hypothetical protein